MYTGRTTNVDSADARLALGAALLVSAGGQDPEGKVSALLSGAPVNQSTRQEMMEALERLFADGSPANLDLSDSDMKAWKDGLLTIKSKLAAIG